MINSFRWLQKKWLLRRGEGRNPTSLGAQQQPQHARLAVLQLEDRVMPAAVYSVTGLAEGPGTLTTAGHAGTLADPFLDTTLRGALAAATADGGNDTVVFASSLFSGGPQTIALDTVGDQTAGPSQFGISTSITIVGPSGNYESPRSSTPKKRGCSTSRPPAA